MTTLEIQNIAAAAIGNASLDVAVSTSTETATISFPALVISASCETHALQRVAISTQTISATLFARSPDYSRAELETLVSDVDSALQTYWTRAVFTETATSQGVPVVFSDVKQEAFEEPRAENENVVFTWRFSAVVQRVSSV